MSHEIPCAGRREPELEDDIGVCTRLALSRQLSIGTRSDVALSIEEVSRMTALPRSLSASILSINFFADTHTTVVLFIFTFEIMRIS